MSKPARKRSRAGKRKSSATKTSRAVDLKAVRQRIIKQVANNACAMVKTSTEEFKKNGNISTLKFLFEAIGLFPCPPGTHESAEDDSLTATLLRRLGLPEENVPDSEVTNDPGMEIVSAAGDNVE
jgi:hypothetical protein